MLHILFNSPFKINIDEMIFMLLPKDCLVALQDGTLILVNKRLFNFCIQNSVKLYVIKEHTINKNINHFINYCHFINYSQFIQLTQRYSKFLSW